MSLITFEELEEFVEGRVLEGARHENVNAASIDVRLGYRFMVEKMERGGNPYVDVSQKEAPTMSEITIDPDKPMVLHPGQFVLAETMERFHLNNDIACEFKLKSSAARAGLNHSLAGWGDPGFNNATLTLELQNVLRDHSLILRPGMKIGQIVFWRGHPVPDEHSYAVKGRYNGQKGPTASKGV